MNDVSSLDRTKKKILSLSEESNFTEPLSYSNSKASKVIKKFIYSTVDIADPCNMQDTCHIRTS